MEQRRFCAVCNAPAVKGASFCVVCGSSEFILPEAGTPVKPVEIDDAVVSVSAESKFIRADNGNDFTVSLSDETTTYVMQEPVKPQYGYPQQHVQPMREPAPQPRTNVLSNEERTVAYKSFEEYERELAEKKAEKKADNDNEGGNSKGGKIALVILSIFLSLLIAVCTFVLGVYLTYEGYLDDYLPKTEVEVDDKYQKEMEECYDIRQDLANIVAQYISDNGIYVDKTTTITIESIDDGERCLVDVDGECLSASECADLFQNNYICPSEGTYEIAVVPYVDSDGKSMFKIEVTCDGGEDEYLHK